MRDGQRLWSREELLLAINLYSRLSFGQIDSRNPDIIHLASLIARTPGSVGLKLANFASLDPSIRNSNRKGMTNASKLDKQIWNEYYHDGGMLAFESERLLAAKTNTTLEKEYIITEEELPRDGQVREQLIQMRVNQTLFRKIVLTSYNNTCCITGINEPALLIAGHISPWSKDFKNRMNPANGIAINALHDKAFDAGLLTITPEYKIKISSKLLNRADEKIISTYFVKYHEKSMILPRKFLPDGELLEFHNKYKFQV